MCKMFFINYFLFRLKIQMADNHSDSSGKRKTEDDEEYENDDIGNGHEISKQFNQKEREKILVR